MSLIEKLFYDFKSNVQYKIKTCANTLEKWKDEIKNFFDTWITNAFTELKNIKAINLLWSSLKNVYLSDKKLDKYWLIPWKEKSWISNLPIESFLMQLKANSYNGFITIKVDPQELWVWSEEIIIKNLEKIKNYYSKYYLNFK